MKNKKDEEYKALKIVLEEAVCKAKVRSGINVAASLFVGTVSLVLLQAAACFLLASSFTAVIGVGSVLLCTLCMVYLINSQVM